ncbi:MAG TPA: hypothetical protein DCF33_12905 [Saprospirales bacterium]|nr:type II toxin-antitoxin system RelE/ParE family toxin [Saprospiraceae bacterium]HAD13322.1 hypothetical protein [Saprospirales bacterium]
MTSIHWTETAKDDYLAILKTLYEQSADLAIALDDKMESLISNLRQFRYLCPPSRKFPKFRRCILTKNLALVYEASEDSLLIISIFDTRAQHPFN